MFILIQSPFTVRVPNLTLEVDDEMINPDLLDMDLALGTRWAAVKVPVIHVYVLFVLTRLYWQKLHRSKGASTAIGKKHTLSPG